MFDAVELCLAMVASKPQPLLCPRSAKLEGESVRVNGELDDVFVSRLVQLPLVSVVEACRM
jgi:hypothetical protein